MSSICAAFTLTRADFQLDLSFTVPAKGITALFGNSGSGKTTLLRCIAGLEKPDKGELQINGEIWQSADTFRPVHRRSVGYVFQESNLFNHLNVEKNLRYGLNRTPRHQQCIPFEQAVELLSLRSLLIRMPSELSGGQRQRVAIARALLSSPTLLLMDEPLASLDLESKADIFPYLDRIHEQLEIPIFYVSHSPDEVVRIADHMLLLEHGKIAAEGAINELLTRTDLPISHLDQASAVVNGKVIEHDRKYHLSTVKIAGGYVSLPLLNHPTEKEVRIRILARDVSLAYQPSESSSITNTFPVKIAEISKGHDPAKVLIKLDMGGEFILSQITAKSADTLQLSAGTTIFAQIKSVALMR